MRKRSLILLALALCLTLLTAASAWADTSYYIYIGDTEITSSNASDVFSDGSVSYDSSTATLTLNGFTYEGQGHKDGSLFTGIYINAGKSVTLELIGENSVKLDPADTGCESVALLFNNSYSSSNRFSVKGSGSIALRAGDIEGASLETSTIGASLGGLSLFGNDFSGSFMAEGGDVSGPGRSRGISGNILLYGGSVTGIGGDHSGPRGCQSCGIYGGAHQIYGGVFTGIGGDVSSEDGSGATSWGIDGSNDYYDEINILAGTVIARGGKANSGDGDGYARSYGIYKSDQQHPFSGGTRFTPGLNVYGGTLIAGGGDVSKDRANPWPRVESLGVTGGTVRVDGGSLAAKAGTVNGSFLVSYYDSYSYTYRRCAVESRVVLGDSKVAGAVG
ncbi:MAG: hypothetical protein II488_03475, partial [Firmicutes bacterium]|nr:hypothetical protein [Bacillota bacterium]